MEKPVELVDRKLQHHRILHYTLRSENRAEFKGDKRTLHLVECTRVKATKLLGGLGSRLSDSVILINPTAHSLPEIEEVIREVRQLYEQLNCKLSELGHPPLPPPIIAVLSLDSGTEGGEKIS